MGSELTVVKENWLELANDKAMPQPFQHEIYLQECHVAGTTHVGDIGAKTKDLSEGDVLTLRRDHANEVDPLAIAVYTDKNELIGWIPQRKNTVFSRLMDAGKLLYAKVSSKEVLEEDCWIDIRIDIYMRDI